MELNTEQQLAVEHTDGPLLILAGAGSGKTTVLMHRAEKILKSGRCAPEKLCLLTFTNKAAKELQHRLSKKIGPSAKKCFAGTFHSLGLILLRMESRSFGLPKEFGIIDQTDSTAIIRSLLKDFNHSEKSGFDSTVLLEKIYSWREEKRTEAAKDDIYEETCEWILPRYEARLRLLGCVDFHGLLWLPVSGMEQDATLRERYQSLFSYIMVDEFQDTNVLQMKFLKLLAEPHQNLAVVGDDDQSIYGWRGAEVKNILSFPQMYQGSKVVKLESNYRSFAPILDVANAVIEKNTERFPKRLKTVRSEPGEMVEVFSYPGEQEECLGILEEIQKFSQEGVPLGNIAILYRSNGQSGPFEIELRSRRIPYQVSGGTAFLDRTEIRDGLAFLKVAVFQQELALRRVLNIPPRGLGEKAVERLEQDAQDSRCTLWQSLLKNRMVSDFTERLQALKQNLETSSDPGSSLLQFLDQIGYPEYLKTLSKRPEMGIFRWRSMESLARILTSKVTGERKKTLRQFLDAFDLRETLETSKQDALQLMTLHACKGLEFDVVFLVGVEEDLLPHRQLGTNISEERRLFYVGITRARKRLYLSHVERRMRNGKLTPVAPSRFLLEIPPSLLRKYSGGRPLSQTDRKSMLAELYQKLDSLNG